MVLGFNFGFRNLIQKCDFMCFFHKTFCVYLLKTYFFLKKLFLFVNIISQECRCSLGSEKGVWFPGAGVNRGEWGIGCKLHNLGDGSQFQVFCKSFQLSYLLGHFSSTVAWNFTLNIMSSSNIVIFNFLVQTYAYTLKSL